LPYDPLDIPTFLYSAPTFLDDILRTSQESQTYWTAEIANRKGWQVTLIVDSKPIKFVEFNNYMI